MTYYDVYLVEYLGAPRNHHGIFVEHVKEGGGVLFHVVGDIQNGMSYESKTLSKRPEESMSFSSRAYLGRIKVADAGRFDAVCRSIAPPAKQFHGPRKLDPSAPLRRCQEWTREVISALRSQGILVA
ncbi:hypothetical protein SODALDRAFT_333650 [Sodiomyces alkalinus F11]|uniref:Uncharacterized protein n=1 Tax=Sodiomyces alkalinus (strain CBS 110278 / VKM F-3762 / F11) TaxID=1314773 RepID=A0A3N2PTP6_SODAK|nr:hypothetical protein SODALDRAFT_333650 [Sodiomyces alkalinus F11]ROT37885.1 hypothetical protein SODALDRAFT_333650 [Sodiomyces alkalinus F11]